MEKIPEIKKTVTEITTICESCNFILRDEFNYCPYCGKPVKVLNKEEADKWWNSL